ncbi:hypothetical protein BE04_11215 [Sorangium cellulosum]|uniref:Uncharacterized protein n=2 Tax=Sorangium cellulosum TaxID=56 RepID=A0A150PA10_SORCE|nr:hypothetical protein [Sorangium cellulosum]AGP41427.1 hypothetical protein SCE1572_47235 [Sorangium cellulosum So0157-2]KYF52545.1 hypothetical protein BE04_11215 [Sorangium cellulosum]
MADGVEDERAGAERRVAERRVAELREQLFVHRSRAIDAAALGELRAAEEKLNEAQRATPSGGGGLILDTSARKDRPVEMMGPSTTGLDVEVRLRMTHVPSATAHLLDASTPLVSFRLKNLVDTARRLRLVSYVEGYSAEAVDCVEIEPTQEATVGQMPTFFPKALREIQEATRASLRVRVDDLDGKVEVERAYPIWLAARTTAYLSVRDPYTGEDVDMTRYLAAWVTPNADEVMKLLRKAAERAPSSFIGYQQDGAKVEEQVRACFEVCKQAGVTYVNSVLAFGAGPEARAQRVRLPRESIANTSANCIDGTVLLASLLEAASLTPAIVVVPGHAFLGWRKRRGADEWDYVETTMIKDHSFEDAVAAARAVANEYEERRALTKRGSSFRRHALDELRQGGVIPME